MVYRDAPLYRGRLVEALDVMVDADWLRLTTEKSMSSERARLVVETRLVLRAAYLLEGWAVSLARWILEAAASGSAQPGPAEELLWSCQASLKPSAHELLAHTRHHGHISRANVSRALGQCASHHGMWAQLAQRSAAAFALSGALPSARANINGIDEFNRILWSPLHFAAACGSALVLEELLALSPHNPMPHNGVGLTPLHVAVVHESLEVVGALVRAQPLAVEQRCRRGRTPAELAVISAPTTPRCRRLLAALGVASMESKMHCTAAAEARSKGRRARVGYRSAYEAEECSGDGGWGVAARDEGDAAMHCTDADSSGTSDGVCARSDSSDTARRCDLPMVDSLDAAGLIHDHMVAGRPVLVKYAMRHATASCKAWTRQRFLAAHSSLVLSPETYPYAGASSDLYGVPKSNATSVEELLVASGSGDGSGDARGVSSPHGVFNALHGWSRITYNGVGNHPTDVPEQRSAHGDIQVHLEGLKPSSRENLLANFVRPPFLEDELWLLRTDSIQFYYGARGSGAQPHWHGSAWNWQVYGRKRWYLWPPSIATYTQHHVDFSVGSLREQEMQRMESRDSQSSDGIGRFNVTGKPLVCEQRAGEVIVVPHLWGHATMNLETSIGWASEFQFDRIYDDGLAATHGDEWWRVGESKSRAKRYG